MALGIVATCDNCPAELAYSIDDGEVVLRRACRDEGWLIISVDEVYCNKCRIDVEAKTRMMGRP